MKEESYQKKRSELIEELRKKYLLVEPYLNERSQRFFAAVEALSLGHGGITLVSEATGLSRTTIRSGLAELEQKASLDTPKLRAEGGGRKPITEAEPELANALLSLIQPNEENALSWVEQSPKELARALERQKLFVSPPTLKKLLKEWGYRSTGMATSLKDSQYRLINQQIEAHLKQEIPVLIVKSVKMTKAAVEQITTPSQHLNSPWEEAIYYRVYEIGKQVGYLNFSLQGEPLEGLAASIYGWYRKMGGKPKKLYLLFEREEQPSLKKKQFLQGLANQLGAEIQVSYLAGGFAKWNQREHRLFDYLADHWFEHPLLAQQMQLSYGWENPPSGQLKVWSEVVPHPKKITQAKGSPDKEVTAFEWNYTLKPQA